MTARPAQFVRQGRSAAARHVGIRRVAAAYEFRANAARTCSPDVPDAARADRTRARHELPESSAHVCAGDRIIESDDQGEGDFDRPQSADRSIAPPTAIGSESWERSRARAGRLESTAFLSTVLVYRYR